MLCNSWMRRRERPALQGGAGSGNVGLLAGYSASTYGVLVHDEGSEASVELALELAHARLIGLILLLVELARLVVRVEPIARRMLPQDLIVESLQGPVIVDYGNAGICIW